MATENGLDLAAEGKIGEDILLMGDEARIRQVLVNLLKHAVSVTEQGQVSLALTTKRVGRGLSLCFSVMDQGPGISRANLMRMFDGPEASEEGQAGARVGAGLGLAVSRRLARLMGGDLRVQSEMGRGSTFTLTMPMELVTAVGGPLALRSEGEDRIDLSGRHVMIVNDSADNRKMLEMMILETGSQISQFLTSDPLLEKVYDLAPDVIVIDVSSPLETGLIATAMIREAEAAAGAGRCVIVAITDTALADDRKRCVDAGVDAVVPKPVTRARLLAALKPLSGQSVTARRA